MTFCLVHIVLLKILVSRYCLQCGLENEFFIKRAIGWALRQYYKTNPKSVKAFVSKNKNNLSELSIKEALKHAKK